jgi:hypothetical protein
LFKSKYGALAVVVAVAEKVMFAPATPLAVAAGAGVGFSPLLHTMQLAYPRQLQ